MNKIEKEKLKKYQQQIYGNPNWINGRINRAEYFARCLLLGLGSVVMTPGWSFGLLQIMLFKSTLGYALFGICLLLDLWISWRIAMAYVKRAHDLNWPGWIAILVVLYRILSVEVNTFKMPETLQLISSILILILSLIFLFKRGTKGVNKYGKDPLTKYEENE